MRAPACGRIDPVDAHVAAAGIDQPSALGQRAAARLRTRAGCPTLSSGISTGFGRVDAPSFADLGQLPAELREWVSRPGPWGQCRLGALLHPGVLIKGSSGLAAWADEPALHAPAPLGAMPRGADVDWLGRD